MIVVPSIDRLDSTSFTRMNKDTARGVRSGHVATINDGERMWKKNVDRACNRDNGQWEVWQGPEKGRRKARDIGGQR